MNLTSSCSDSYDLLGCNNETDVPVSSDCQWSNDISYRINVTTTPTLYVEIVCYPILLILCSFGNFVSIIILTTDLKKTSTNVYLIFLAASDLCVVWFAMPFYIAEVDQTTHDVASLSEIHYLNFKTIATWWQESCIQFSDWTLIVFSMERLFAIARPLQCRNRLTIARIVCIELVVLLFSALFPLQNLVMWFYLLAHDDGVSSKFQIATPGLLAWEVMQNQIEIVVTIAKWLLLSFVNINLIISLSHNTNLRHSIARYPSASTADKSPGTAPSKLSSKRTTNLVLLSCCIVYFFTQFPNVVFKILELASHPPYCTFHLTYRSREAARPLIFISFLTNYSVNFLLYCLVWKKFRDELRSRAWRLRQKFSSTVIAPIRLFFARNSQTNSEFSVKNRSSISEIDSRRTVVEMLFLRQY